MLRFPLLLLFLMMFGGLWSAAQTPAQTAPKVSSTISARTIGEGQQAVLSYQINGSLSAVEEFPETIQVPGLTIEFNGRTQRMTLRNGLTMTEIGFRYTVTANAQGEYVIPPQSFKVDGALMEGDAVTLTVGAASAPVEDNLTPTVQLKVGKTEFWKGEVVPVQVAILVHPAVQPLSQFFPQVKTPNFAVNRFDRSAGLETRQVNGEIWRAWQMESVMSALQSGAQVFGPAEFKAELLTPDVSGFGDPMGRQQGNRSTRFLTSNTVPVNVKELPLEGKPDNFTGAVGDFEISAEASPVVLNAGDPIAVEMVISGVGNFDALTPPVMEPTEGWRLYEPRVSQENRGWGTEPGRKSFTQILIPEKKHTTVPSFVLSYFNPDTGAYVTRKSQPVALTVKGEFKAASSAEADAKDFAAPVDAASPMEDLGDILDKPLSHPPGGSWLSMAAQPIPVNRNFMHGVPAVLLAFLIGRGIRRRRRAAARPPLPGAPREPYLVLADLRRQGIGRRPFYTHVNEYLTSVAHHRQRQPVPGGELDAVLMERDRWLYGPDDAAVHEPLPESTQRQTLEVLSRL